MNASDHAELDSRDGAIAINENGAKDRTVLPPTRRIASVDA